MNAMNKNCIYNSYIHDIYMQTKIMETPQSRSFLRTRWCQSQCLFFLLRIFFVTALALNPAQQTKCTVITGCYITKSSISLHPSLEDGFK